MLEMEWTNSWFTLHMEKENGLGFPYIFENMIL